MGSDDERIEEAVKNTEILRPPKRSLATFGTTNVYYYLVTEPSYSELVKSAAETVIREGRVIAEKPKIVTPLYLSHLEGFSTEAKRYFESLVNTFGANAPGQYYRNMLPVRNPSLSHRYRSPRSPPGSSW